ncbi:MAG: helix-turn-helix domain-containing protein [Bacteroidales bacterium]|nr:helix-turn-helix domain-containing protein [Bacteroidales bacterium]
MINRINLILRAKNITARQFAEEIGIQPSGMSHIMSGRNNPSLDFVSKVIRRYPEIDANWLLLGKGEMYASGAAPSFATPPTPDEEPLPEPAHRPEPTLFSTEPDELPKVEEPSREPLYQDEAIREEEAAYKPSYVVSAPEPQPSSARTLERILFIYSDHTFSEYHPS